MTTNSPFRSIRTPRISLEIVEQIQEAIFRGDFAAGDRLPPERELVQTFGVSKVTVREALRILETYGLISIRPGASGGAFVNERTSQPVSRAVYNQLQLEGFSISQLYTARILFEPAVAELACQSANDEDLRELEASVERTRQLVAEGQKTSPESQEFHSILIRSAKNPVIQIILSSLLDLIKLSRALVPSTPEISKMVLDDHEAIVEAMRQRDAAKVKALMTDHLSKLSSQFTKMEEQGIKVTDGDHAF